MDLREALKFGGIEEEINHWWIKTRFNYLNEIIEYYNSNNLTIVEYGCGTGNNIYHLLHRSPFSPKIKSIIGIDPKLSNLEVPDWAKECKCSFNNSLPNSIKADIVIAMDVLEHIQDDYLALKEWKSSLKPNGLLLISVPAFQHLWSSHDIFLRHHRRYNKKEISELANSTGLKTVKLNYIFSYIYPMVFLLRRYLPNKAKIYGDLKKHNEIINTILSILGNLEYKFGGSNLFGTSLVGIFKNSVP